MNDRWKFEARDRRLVFEPEAPAMARWMCDTMAEIKRKIQAQELKLVLQHLDEESFSELRLAVLNEQERRNDLLESKNQRAAEDGEDREPG